MIRKGSKVQWNWGSGQGIGKIKEVFTEEVEKTIGGKKIKRKASKEEPAYLIQQENKQVLKSRSEIERV